MRQPYTAADGNARKEGSQGRLPTETRRGKRAAKNGCRRKHGERGQAWMAADGNAKEEGDGRPFNGA